jgi:uncharacterized protein YidB (DUF937 family)
MGLFDEIEKVAGIGGQGGAAPQPGGATAVVTAVTQVLQTYPGGIGGIVQQFEKAGLGGVARSWVEAGHNQPVTPGQVQSALGAGSTNEVAKKLDLPPGEAAGQIARFLPLIIDHLTPGGALPQGGDLGAIGGLLSRLGSAHP